jgi:hypothetical protein
MQLKSTSAALHPLKQEIEVCGDERGLAVHDAHQRAVIDGFEVVEHRITPLTPVSRSGFGSIGRS